MGGLAGCMGGGGHLSLVVLVSEKPNLVSEKSGKSQGILFICGAGNPDQMWASMENWSKDKPPWWEYLQAITELVKYRVRVVK